MTEIALKEFEACVVGLASMVLINGVNPDCMKAGRLYTTVI